jgi:hypothetical protein
LKDQVAIIIARQLTVVLSLILTAFRLANRNAYRLWHGTRLGSARIPALNPRTIASDWHLCRGLSMYL